MGHYKANVRDLEFNLFEVFGRQEILGKGIYADVDVEAAKDILGEVARLAENELAASLVDSDRNPPVYDPVTCSVTIPESFKKSYRAYLDGEWGRLDTPVELGGMAVPPSLRWAIAEMICGANPAVHMYGATFSFARLLWFLGTPEQKKLAKLIIDNAWHTTMVLTEPDAGSDVGAGRTKAVQQPDGTWHITGVKRFITSAESDMCDNIVHFVLARPEGAVVGTKGLSLFIVPKFHVDVETGEIGERNGAYVTNVEHKMGLKVSTTCEVTFGEKQPAVGTLLGDVHDGIAQMFHIIEGARMFVGTKAIATLSAGYLNAVDYAKQIGFTVVSISLSLVAVFIPLLFMEGVMGRLLREMSEEMGEDMGPEFDEVVGRLERGDSPEEIEESLPDLGGDDLGGGPALGGMDALGAGAALGGDGED